MALEDKAHQAVARGATVGERDDGHRESLAVLHTVSFYSNRRGGHLLSSLWAFGVSPATGAAREGNEPLHARWG